MSHVERAKAAFGSKSLGMVFHYASRKPAPWWLRQGVPPTAKRSVFELHERIRLNPQLKEHMVRCIVANHPNNEDGVFTWGTYLNAGRNVVPVAIATLPDGLFIYDALSCEERVGIDWNCVVRSDVRHAPDVATVGLVWYDGLQAIEERMKDGRLLEADELSGGYFFVLDPRIAADRDPVPSNTLVFNWINEAIVAQGVPSSAHDVPQLI